jgi:DNA-binding transcriptional LysR family regulator
LLNVGFTSSASMHPLTPQILRAFRGAYPQAQIEVQESETYELILALQQRRIDAAFLHISADRFPDLTSKPLAEEGMIAAIAADHPLAKEPDKPVTLPMFDGQPFVIYRRPDGPGLFNDILNAFDEAGISIRIVDEVHRLIAALNLVAAGRGLTIVPASVGVLHKTAIVYRPIARRALPPLPFFLAHRKDNNLALVENFIRVTNDLVKSQAGEPKRAKARR